MIRAVSSLVVASVDGQRAAHWYVANVCVFVVENATDDDVPNGLCGRTLLQFLCAQISLKLCYSA